MGRMRMAGLPVGDVVGSIGSVALAVVGADALLMRCNRTAKALLQDGDTLYAAPGGFLAHRNPKDSTQFQALISRRWRRPTYFVFHDKSDVIRLAVSVVRSDDEPTRLLWLKPLVRRPLTRLAPVAQAMGLTPTESAVLLELLNGKDAAGIAKELGMAILTARTHLKNLYRKCGVNSRGELFELVLRIVV
jgi:DNA-binding CsgD family transcriptional regulator